MILTKLDQHINEMMTITIIFSGSKDVFDDVMNELIKSSMLSSLALQSRTLNNSPKTFERK